MNKRPDVSIPPQEEGTFANWTFHEWAEAFSTNDLARTYAPWHIAVCAVQTNGRGRFNRKWIGQQGGLWASFNVPIDEKNASSGINWGHLPLVAGLALLNMLRNMGINNARLRWPNDLLIGNSKLAGILVERPAADMAVIGIGINVHNDVASIAAEIKDPPVRMADLIPDCPSTRAVMVALAIHLEAVFKRFSQNGLQAIHKELSHAWAGERIVSIHLDEESIYGIFRGIDEHGNPMLLLEDRTPYTVQAHLINRLVEEQDWPFRPFTDFGAH